MNEFILLTVEKKKNGIVLFHLVYTSYTHNSHPLFDATSLFCASIVPQGDLPILFEARFLCLVKILRKVIMFGLLG